MDANSSPTPVGSFCSMLLSLDPSDGAASSTDVLSNHKMKKRGCFMI